MMHTQSKSESNFELIKSLHTKQYITCTCNIEHDKFMNIFNIPVYVHACVNNHTWIGYIQRVFRCLAVLYRASIYSHNDP